MIVISEQLVGGYTSCEGMQFSVEPEILQCLVLFDKGGSPQTSQHLPLWEGLSRTHGSGSQGTRVGLLPWSYSHHFGGKEPVNKTGQVSRNMHTGGNGTVETWTPYHERVISTPSIPGPYIERALVCKSFTTWTLSLGRDQLRSMGYGRVPYDPGLRRVLGFGDGPECRTAQQRITS